MKREGGRRRGEEGGGKEEGGRGREGEGRRQAEMERGRAVCRMATDYEREGGVWVLYTGQHRNGASAPP